MCFWFVCLFDLCACLALLGFALRCLLGFAWLACGARVCLRACHTDGSVIVLLRYLHMFARPWSLFRKYGSCLSRSTYLFGRHSTLNVYFV